MNDNTTEVIRSATLDELRQMKERGEILTPDQIKQDVWDIRVLQEVTLRVVFDEEVTLDEAEELFLNGEHQDVLDEVDDEIVSILNQETGIFIDVNSDFEGLEEDE